MRKFHNLKLLGLVTILAGVLIFVGINFVLAGSKGKNYTWKAVILNDSLNLAGEDGIPNGEGWMYEDSDEYVNVSAGMGWCMSGPKKPTRCYYPYFAFEVNHPTKIQFKNMLLDTWGEDEKLVRCGFPTDVLGWPDCLENFLNNEPQPMEGYKRVFFGFRGPSCTNQEDADINNMQIGVPMQIRLRFFIEGQDLYGSCEECYKLYYHCVRGVAHGYTKPNFGQPDIYLVRMDTDTWKIVVNTDFDNPNYSNSSYPAVFDYQNDMISEEYCECEEVPFKGKKIRYKKHIRHSAWTRGHMEFQIKFIRTRK